MARGYQLIQAQTLTGTATSVTFTNIPQNFTDLVIKVSARSDKASTFSDLTLKFNGSTSSYSNKIVYGDGATIGSYANNYTNQAYLGTMAAASTTANVFTNQEVYIPGYTLSNKKSFSVDSVTENNATSAYQILGSNLWDVSSAITSIELTSQTSGLFVANSTFYLYGVGGSKASGGTITVDANYTYHTFTSTSNFIPYEKITGAEVLMVAGGGGGGCSYGGGGGAGGIIYTPGQTLIAGTSYTTIVGAGGSSGTNSTAPGSGTNSLFASATAIGGGKGGSYNTSNAGANGGSGGGAGSNGGAGGAWLTAGTGTSGQGNNGGTSVYTIAAGGGGGGAGSAGAAGSTGIGGDGGAGSTAYTYWGYATSTGEFLTGTYYYAGGGGGGSTVGGGNGYAGGIGGLGGGGAGTHVANGNGTAGTANTGGGGGGSGYYSGSAVGGAGGSGLVIIRYPSN